MLLFLFLLLSNAQEKPTQENMCTDFGNVRKCKTLFAEVDIPFCGENETPNCLPKEIIVEGKDGNPGKTMNISCPSCSNKTMDDKPKIPDNKQCFIHGMVVRCKLAKVDLQFCKKTQESSGEDSGDDSDGGKRPKCVKSEVTWEGKDGKPDKIYNISCPSCVPMEFLNHMCKEKQVTRCEKNEKPTMKWAPIKRSLCPTCFKIPDKSDECTKEQRNMCIKKLKDAELETCVDREVPTKKDCCFSCSPAKKPTEDKCRSKIAELPECEKVSDGGEDKRDEARKLNVRDNDGCRECVPKSPARIKGKKCSIADFRECRESAPTCEMNEKALVDKESTRCCPPCVRQASKANLLEVIACRKELPECETDDKSKRNVFLPGEACPICEPKKPASCSACKQKQICVRDRDGEAKCVGKKKFVMTMKLRAGIKHALRSVKEKTMTRVLKEFVSRYCERNGAAEACLKLKDRVLDSVEVTGKRNGTTDDALILNVEVAESDSTTLRRLLAEDDETILLLNDAAQDDDDYVSSSETGIIDDDDSSSSKIFVFISIFLSIIGIFQF